MQKRRADLSDVDQDKFLAALWDLVHEHPGQPIALVEEAGIPKIGVMNIIAEDDDWMVKPIDIPDFVALTTDS